MTGIRKICLGCFDGFRPNKSSIGYCSDDCRNLVRWEKQEARLLDTGATDRQLEEHRRRHPKRRIRRLLNLEDESDMAEYVKAMRELRYERIRQGKMDDIDLGELILRDRGACHICGKQVAKRKKYGSRKGPRGKMANQPTIDHIVPVSRGGEHTWENVKLAHRSCNSRKGGRMPIDLPA